MKECSRVNNNGILGYTLELWPVRIVVNELLMLPFYANFMPPETILAAGSGGNQ